MNNSDLYILNEIYNKCMYYDSSTARNHIEVFSDYTIRKYFNGFLSFIDNRVKDYLNINSNVHIPEIKTYKKNIIEISALYITGILSNTNLYDNYKYKILIRMDEIDNNSDNYLSMYVLHDNTIISIYVLFERNMNLFFKRLGYNRKKGKYCNDVESAMNHTYKTGI